MAFAVRLTIRVKGINRNIHQFVRADEYTPNTAARAYHYDTRKDAELAANIVKGFYEQAGSKVIAIEYVEVKEGGVN